MSVTSTCDRLLIVVIKNISTRNCGYGPPDIKCFQQPGLIIHHPVSAGIEYYILEDKLSHKFTVNQITQCSVQSSPRHNSQFQLIPLLARTQELLKTTLMAD